MHHLGLLSVEVWEALLSSGVSGSSMCVGSTPSCSWPYVIFQRIAPDSERRLKVISSRATAWTVCSLNWGRRCHCVIYYNKFGLPCSDYVRRCFQFIIYELVNCVSFRLPNCCRVERGWFSEGSHVATSRSCAGRYEERSAAPRFLSTTLQPLWVEHHLFTTQTFWLPRVVALFHDDLINFGSSCVYKPESAWLHTGHIFSFTPFFHSMCKKF